MDGDHQTALVDTFKHIADMFRRRRFKAALGLISALFECHFENLFLRSRLTLLQVYCNLKLENFVAASIPLDALPPLPADSSSLQHSLRCSSDDFILQLFAALFPLCFAQLTRYDVSQRPPPFPHPQHANSLERLYQLLDWTRECLSALQGTQESPLFEIWSQRHVLVVRVLVDALVQVELYEVALALIHSDILSRQPNSQLGMAMLGLVYLIMGDIQLAKDHFKIAERLTETPSLRPFIPAVEGILQLANGQFSASVTQFQDAVARATSASIQRSGDVRERSSGALANKRLATGELELAIATNNLAVSLLYDGRVREATEKLDASLSSLSKRPFPYFVALRNLITLYEFAPQRSRKIAGLCQTLSDFGTDESELLQLLYETGEEQQGK